MVFTLAGKTTLVKCLGKALDRLDIRTGFCSIDDFYLTHAEQQEVEKQHPSNLLLQGRGLAGTHDIDLGVRTITQLVECRSGAVDVPAYDKRAFHGLGDRAEKPFKVEAPLDLVVLEGWMLGFVPVEQGRAAEYPGMSEVNQMLQRYRAWNALLDSIAVASVDNYRVVYKWREEAELHRRKAGSGLSHEEVVQFCDRYMPSYELYARRLFREGLEHVPKARTLCFKLSEGRLPVA